jgi:ribonuclease HI
VKIYVDGGARGNPGPAAWAVYVEDQGRSFGGYIGDSCTNNLAEWTALVEALKWAGENCGDKTLQIFSDSRLIVEQFNGNWKVKHQELHALWEAAQVFAGQFPHLEVRHIRREFNKHADAKVNQILDKRETYREAFAMYAGKRRKDWPEPPL